MDVEKLYEMLDKIEETEESNIYIDEIRAALDKKDYQMAIEKINNLRKNNITKKNNKQTEINTNHEEIEDENNEILIEEDDENENNDIITDEYDKNENDDITIDKEAEEDKMYPKDLQNYNLEEMYVGMLLNDPKGISMYYVVYEECYFENDMLLNVYKSVLFTEGQAYAPEIAKRGFNFAKESHKLNTLKEDLKEKYYNNNFNFEKIYVELRKLFVLRKNYLGMPIKTIQDKIVEIVHYYLYDKMTIEEVQASVEQVSVTQKFKSAVLSEGLSNFLIKNENSLTNGLEIPFKILTEVFKGLRKGETVAFAMPSNSGKSRFTINLASHIAFVHKKKVLIISNEMSEEKMKLCLITTILNNKEIQKLHGQKVHKTEGELLEFKFRPDDSKNVKIDDEGFVVKEENETQEEFAKRLEKISTEYRQTIEATSWLDKQINNSIYFINITDHTNEELKKVIVNYYYKEKIEYMFYDTMKTDTENIGNGEELKKTATILSNLAQEFNIFIGSTIQLTETSTLPINLNINDLAVSKTVKEVLDGLCLIKQIQKENYDDYKYSLREVGDECKDLEKFDDPNVRYYAWIVDKNRAGAKPKLLFRLNLAYNVWEELGYLRLKEKK